MMPSCLHLPACLLTIAGILTVNHIVRALSQVVEIAPTSPGPKQLSYDAQWLAILRETHDLLRPGSYTRLPATWSGMLHSSNAVHVKRSSTPVCIR